VEKLFQKNPLSIVVRVDVVMTTQEEGPDESTSIFQQRFRRLFIAGALLLGPELLTKHTSSPPPSASLLRCQLYSLYLCIMYIHMYTVKKRCRATNVA